MKAKLNGLSVRDHEIRLLQNEAAEAGDASMVQTCRAALGGMWRARELCAEKILVILVEAAMNLARAYDDPRPNVQTIRDAEKSACAVGDRTWPWSGRLNDDELIDWMLAFGRQFLGGRKAS